MTELEKWLNSEAVDESTKKELLSCTQEELEERFYTYLSFGTGGLRGTMGAGTNRMNIYTVRHASQSVANVIKKHFTSPSVVIAHDSRNNAVAFTNAAAEVFYANGIKVYTFDDLRPTPLLSFAVKELKCSAGIVLTASHNPKEYNGYKVYGSDGVQITNALADEIADEMTVTDIFSGVKFDKEAKPIVLGEDFDDIYLQNVLKQQVFPEAVKRHPDLPIVYTPFHGAGRRLVPEALKRAGFTNIITVKEQMVADGNFPTVVSPNPEKAEGFTLGVKLAKEKGAALVIANDPDADRVGLAVRKNDGEYILLTGNQEAAILVNYILAALKEQKLMPEKPFMVTTIVTADTGERICRKYGAELFYVLTGFKYIGEKVLQQQALGKTFLYGFEESYGGLKGTYCGDKDGVCVALLLAEAAAFYADRDKTLWDALTEVYDEFGYHSECTTDIILPGIAGFSKMQETMKNLRANPIKEFEGNKVVNIKDYVNGLDGLPASNVIRYEFEDSSVVVARPSGTEPKLKMYTLVSAEDITSADKKRDRYETMFRDYVKQVGNIKE